MMREYGIGVSAFIYRGNEVLVVKRSDSEETFPGLWEIPGGGLEYGESLMSALEREILEEVGLKVKVGELYYAFSYISERTGRQIAELHYLAEPLNNESVVTLNDTEHSEYRWIGVDQLDQLSLSTEISKSISLGFDRIRRVDA